MMLPSCILTIRFFSFVVRPTLGYLLVLLFFLAVLLAADMSYFHELGDSPAHVLDKLWFKLSCSLLRQALATNE